MKGFYLRFALRLFRSSNPIALTFRGWKHTLNTISAGGRVDPPGPTSEGVSILPIIPDIAARCDRRPVRRERTIQLFLVWGGSIRPRHAGVVRHRPGSRKGGLRSRLL